MAEQPDRMHQTRLKSLYRVCGCSLKHSRTVYDSKNHKDDLLAVFHIDITRDSTTIHPDRYCQKCRTVITKSKKVATEGKVYMHRVKAFEWHSHDPSGCSICAIPVGGGDPRNYPRIGDVLLLTVHTHSLHTSSSVHHQASYQRV